MLYRVDGKSVVLRQICGTLPTYTQPSKLHLSSASEAASLCDRQIPAVAYAVWRCDVRRGKLARIYL